MPLIEVFIADNGYSWTKAYYYKFVLIFIL